LRVATIQIDIHPAGDAPELAMLKRNVSIPHNLTRVDHQPLRVAPLESLALASQEHNLAYA
jgi:hypothetical protein